MYALSKPIQDIWKQLVPTLIDMVAREPDVWMVEKAPDDAFLDSIQGIVDDLIPGMVVDVLRVDTTYAEVRCHS